MRSIFLLFFWLATGVPLHAQIKSVSVKVTDTTGTLSAGNYLLTDTTGKLIENSSFYGTITITGIDHTRLLLKLSSIMFNDTTLSIRYTGDQVVDMGTIVPKENTTMLGQVTITGSAPLMRYGNNGNLEVNVAGTILATSSSVNEILFRTPGVTVSEGIISLQGKGEAIIYLNGTLIVGERLASIPASQITKIEIITNPSARYDAGGRAVISITTKAPGHPAPVPGTQSFRYLSGCLYHH